MSTVRGDGLDDLRIKFRENLARLDAELEERSDNQVLKVVNGLEIVKSNSTLQTRKPFGVKGVWFRTQEEAEAHARKLSPSSRKDVGELEELEERGDANYRNAAEAATAQQILKARKAVESGTPTEKTKAESYLRSKENSWYINANPPMPK